MRRKLALLTSYFVLLSLSILAIESRFNFAFSATCDNNCRHKTQFWNCKANPQKGYYYEKGDCYMCTEPGCWCDIKDSTASGKCKQTGMVNRYKTAGFTEIKCKCDPGIVTAEHVVAPNGDWMNTEWSVCNSAGK